MCLCSLPPALLCICHLCYVARDAKWGGETTPTPLGHHAGEVSLQHEGRLLPAEGQQRLVIVVAHRRTLTDPGDLRMQGANPHGVRGKHSGDASKKTRCKKKPKIQQKGREKKNGKYCKNRNMQKLQKNANAAISEKTHKKQKKRKYCNLIETKKGGVVVHP